MIELKKTWLMRILLGGCAALAVMFMVAWCCSGILSGPSALRDLVLVGQGAIRRFGSYGLALLLQSLLCFALGACIGVATLPFADDGSALILRSLAHFTVTAALFSLLALFFLGLDPAYLIPWLGMLLAVYLVVWLGRWVGWYTEVTQLRIKLGLAPGPSPLHWRETLPYLPFVLLVCDVLPPVLRACDARDVPFLIALLYPFVILPLAGICSGFSLGKRQGFCPLYPAVCFVCYLPVVFLILNPSALYQCFLSAAAALAGNLAGAVLRRHKRRS